VYVVPKYPRPQGEASAHDRPSSPPRGSGFPDIAPWIAQIRSAIRDDRAAALSQALARSRAAGDFDTPGFFPEERSDRYARRLIWREPDASFVIVAMTWMPGQYSPLHDHDGLWGAEIVVAGAMCETSFRLADVAEGTRYRFVAESERVSEAGALGVVIPPLEYHDFGNQGSRTAHTVHVYAGDLTNCHAFDATGDGWWNARNVTLGYDA